MWNLSDPAGAGRFFGGDPLAKPLSPKQADRMGSQPIPSLVTQMAIPSVIAMLITTIYNLADTYFVNFLSLSAVAAVGVNGSLDQIIMMAGSLFAVGSASYVSRLLGMGRKDKAEEVLSTALFSAFVTGMIIAVLGFIFMKPLVRLLGATPSCEAYAIEYASYVLYAAPFVATNFVMNQVLRAEGSAIRSMFGMAFGGILNCILDPIFIFGLDLGVAGASIATALSKLVTFCILVYPYVRGKTVLRPSFRKIHYDWTTCKEVVSVGSSSLFRSGFAILAAILLNRSAGLISDACLAAISATTRIMNVPFFTILGFSQGFQPVAGYNWGAKLFDRVRKSYAFSAKVCVLGGAVCGGLLFLFAGPVISLFNSENDPEMLALGMLCIRLQALVLPLHAWTAVVNMLCASMGRGMEALLLATGRQGYCFLPLIFILPPLLGANGVVAVQAVADGLLAVVTVPILIATLRRVDRAEAAYLSQASKH